jgi:ADP-heptose:LPS heptosyltransferase
MAVWANAMRKRQFDLVLDFQGLLRTGLVSRLFGGADVRGLSDAREGARFFYKRTVRVAKDQHAVERYLQLVADLGIDTRRPLEFALPPGKRPAHFSTSGPYLLLHPFARGPAKSMLKADVVSFCRELMPIPIVLAGRSDKHVDLPRNCINMLNKTTLAELIWLIRNAQFVVSVDSGPAHLAAAVGDNLISIHRWSDPHLVGPYNPLAWVWKDGALFQMRDIDEPGGDARARADYLSDLTEFVRKKFAPAAVGRKPAQA